MGVFLGECVGLHSTLQRGFMASLQNCLVSALGDKPIMKLTVARRQPAEVCGARAIASLGRDGLIGIENA